MRVVYITAGAAGMYCGSCLRDNTLVAALGRLGYDAMLVPTYTPITTDEDDVSQGRVFFGGVNVYLQQKSRLFRWTPWFFDRLLDARRLLRWVSRFAARTRAEDLGPMTISMLEGEHGHQRKEVAKLVSWLAQEAKPQVVNLTNALLSGIVPELKRQLNVPVLCTLQGDDIFTEALPEPYRTQALERIRAHCREMDGFITTSNYYTDFMTEYFAIPREKITVVYPGLNLHGHGGERPARDGQPFTIGYFARICPEKGLHVLVDAFRLLKKMPGSENARLRVSGWLGKQHEDYLHNLHRLLARWGHAGDVEHVESPDHAGKIRFLQSIDVLSVPTVYRDPKGLYVLEALANGVPVVQPRHGSFPELIEHTQGGLLVNPEDPEDLARALHHLATNPNEVRTMGERGKAVVHQRFHAERMARETMALYERMVQGANRPVG